MKSGALPLAVSPRTQTFSVPSRKGSNLGTWEAIRDPLVVTAPFVLLLHGLSVFALRDIEVCSRAYLNQLDPLYWL